MPEGVGYGPQNTASIGKTLKYVGSHAYAYSGTIAGSTTSVTALEFTTGSQYIMGEFQINIPTTYGTVASLEGWMRISLNGESIAILHIGLTAADSQTTAIQQVMIPPYTNVTAEVVSSDNQAARVTAATFSGRVYGKRV